MNRYKKANEGIHAPEEVKEKAARPAGKRSYSRWMGAVAAVLAVALIGGIAMWPGQSHEPAPLAADGPGLRTASILSAHTLAAAVYPEMHAYPREDDYFSDYTFESSEAYEQDYTAWQEDMDALRSGTDYTGMMDEFLSDSAAQFLTNAGEENRIYSPLNVYMALSMLAETTGGNSRQQILDLLQVDTIDALRKRAATLWKDHYRDDGTVTTILGNSLWLRDGMTYSQEVLDTLAADYYASSFSGEMGSEEYNQALRDWLNEQTNGLLEEQASQLEMEPETVLALASTIYFKAAWSDEFSPEYTQQDVFHTPSGDVDTDFMRQTMEDSYYWGEHFAAVRISFQQGGFMWLILPDEGYSADQLLDSGEAMEFLLAEKFGYYDEETGKYGYYRYSDEDYEERENFESFEAFEKAKGTWVDCWSDQKYLKINLSMPKFDVSSDLDLIDGLQQLGVTDVFDYHVSNFDPLEASTSDPLYISQAKHAARVKVDEDGCEAAAYTVMMMMTGADMPPEDEVDFTLDRPFLFAITGDSGLPLFVGNVNQPNG